MHLRVLSVQCSGDSREGEGYLACFGESLLLLSENEVLQVNTVLLLHQRYLFFVFIGMLTLLSQELKFFGAVLTLPVIERLLTGIQIGFKGLQNADEVGAAAVDYLRVAGHLVFGYFWARMAQVALREIAAGNTDPFYQAKLQTARFYFAKLFPETATLMRTARAGSKVLMDTDLALA